MNIAIEYQELERCLSREFNEFEVIFRNAINNILTLEYGLDWYNSRKIPFIDKHIVAIQRVKQDLFRTNKEKKNPNVISNLTLGFWVYLFNKDYDRTLWRLHLYKIFQHKRTSRSKVRGELHKIKNLRNRISHCECILKHPYEKYYQEIITFISWINPEISQWIHEVTKEYNLG